MRCQSIYREPHNQISRKKKRQEILRDRQGRYAVKYGIPPAFERQNTLPETTIVKVAMTVNPHKSPPDLNLDPQGCQGPTPPLTHLLEDVKGHNGPACEADESVQISLSTSPSAPLPSPAPEPEKDETEDKPQASWLRRTLFG